MPKITPDDLNKISQEVKSVLHIERDKVTILMWINAKFDRFPRVINNQS